MVEFVQQGASLAGKYSFSEQELKLIEPKTVININIGKLSYSFLNIKLIT